MGYGHLTCSMFSILWTASANGTCSGGPRNGDKALSQVLDLILGDIVGLKRGR